MKRTTIALAIAAVFIVSARGQGFQNLNFESAYNLPPSPPQPNGALVAVTNALPDWTVYDGSLELFDVYYQSNYFSGGSTSAELEGGSVALSGTFSVGLYTGGLISQTGLVPGNAASVRFEAEGPGPGGTFGATGFTVTLGGESLPFSPLSQGPDYILYGANIPVAMDDQTEALAFYVGLSQGVLLDNIEFSTSSVPEPGEWTLIGLGVIMFGFWPRRRGERFG